MNIKHLLAALVGGAAIWQWAHKHQHQTHQRKLARSSTKPHEVTTWEGEGGALPVSGAQTGPRATAATSR